MTSATLDLVECDQCDDPVPDTLQTVDGEDICQSCADDYTVCDRCDKYGTDMQTTDTGVDVCDRCARWHYYRCESCETLAASLTYTDGAYEVCDSCLSDYYACDGCNDALISSGDYCGSCEEDRDRRSHLIDDYGYKPNPVFHGTGPMFLGLELELNTPRDMHGCAETAVDRLGDLGYLKEDSSISHGFEIVTHPMSYDWAMDEFPWGLLNSLKRQGGDAYGNGIHVHVSRAAFDGPCHVYRWMKLFYRNVEQVITVARRKSNEWAAFSPNGRKLVKHYAKGGRGDRYQAINTQNDATFELRIFASSLDPQEVKAALGLAAATVEYTRHLTVSDIAQRDGWAWGTFAAWLNERPEYAPLAQELEKLACAC